MSKVAKFSSVPVVVLIALAGISCDEKKSTKAEGAKVAAPAKPAKVDVKTAVPIDVTLPILFEDYRANEVAADAKYKGKVLRVKALVDRVGKNALDEPYVAFQFGRDGFRASFSTEAGLAELKRSDTVVMRCLAEKGFEGPTLSECMLE